MAKTKTNKEKNKPQSHHLVNDVRKEIISTQQRGMGSISNVTNEVMMDSRGRRGLRNLPQGSLLMMEGTLPSYRLREGHFRQRETHVIIQEH